MFCRDCTAVLQFASIVAASIVGAGIVTSCQKPEFTNRVAVLRFENLTGDPSLDWIGRAASEDISGQLTGTRHHAVISLETLRRTDASLGPRPITAPGVSGERSAAIAAGADRIIDGYSRECVDAPSRLYRYDLFLPRQPP